MARPLLPKMLRDSQSERPSPLRWIIRIPQQVRIERVAQVLGYGLLVLVDLHEEANPLGTLQVDESDHRDQVVGRSVGPVVTVKTMLPVDHVRGSVRLREVQET